MFVRDVMTTDVVTISPDASFSEAMELIRKRGVRRLPVVKNDKVVGIITEKDLLSASPSQATTLDVWELTSLLGKLKIKQIMKKDVIHVHPNTPIEEAARIMTDKKIGSLIVLENERMVGIVTETDIFKVFINMLGARENGIRYVFRVQNVPGILSKILYLMYQCGGNLIAVTTYEKSRDEYNVVVKVRDLYKQEFERKFLEGMPFASIIDVRE
ncbi:MULTISPECIES: CBS domain-containing protein [Pseudothermotoga]|uniref:CBS domain containing protein n=1 Tax=Pseudothermotoga lettingae (strain ATCC BAA-301 / DSM 14385 / NBRC 107922 / TMO) TaxID=416591 RepID=A8F484_PSELT|nr:MULTISPECIES: CBS domain-containing protein [Pseudothermotoga]ABV32968.1 CBS domain containing protein [Pseudothermotoga lettingae TMO]GLI48030.1 CBS domain-containing protein [Pseudothermotoga lettingae TMO]HBJ81011.1 CBS domain-containing protein [Pseudothermotoga sp.]HBT25569.1 CBS domain-containing protein [Pseudothermotoga sp.]